MMNWRTYNGWPNGLTSTCYFSAAALAAEPKNKLQSNLLNTDTKETGPTFHISEAFVL